MSTGLWQPSEAVAPEDGYLKRLNLADTAELLEYVRRDTRMPRKEYEQFAGLLSHIKALEEDAQRLRRENARLQAQINKMRPGYEAEMWREPYTGPVQQGQL